jgi:hypothetical protein
MLSTDGYHSRCTRCAARANREDHLLRTYGLTVAEADALLTSQAGLCAICEAAPAVHIDHDHASGVVRGMLSFRCNAALGQFDDEPDRLRRAADYIERARGA